jgi:hypothetical protein
MRKHVTIAAIVFVASFGAGFCQLPSLSPSPTAAPLASATPSAPPAASATPTVCKFQSWSPEMHIFYGRQDIILEKLSDWSAKPSDHRVFVQVTQGKTSGNVKLFEQSKDGGYTVTEWSPRETSELTVAIDKTIMANKGVNCVGEQIKAVLRKLGKGKTVEGVAEPASASAAFAHAVKEAQGDFIKTVIVFGC